MNYFNIDITPLELTDLNTTFDQATCWIKLSERAVQPIGDFGSDIEISLVDGSYGLEFVNQLRAILGAQGQGRFLRIPAGVEIPMHQDEGTRAVVHIDLDEYPSQVVFEDGTQAEGQAIVFDGSQPYSLPAIDQERRIFRVIFTHLELEKARKSYINS